MKWLQILFSFVMSTAFIVPLVSQATGEWILDDYPECGITGIGVLDDEIYLVVQTMLDLDPTKVNRQVEILKMRVNWPFDTIELSTVYSDKIASRWLVLGDLARSGEYWVFAENNINRTTGDTFFLTLFDENFKVIRQEAKSGHIPIDPYCSYTFANGNYIGLGSAYYPPDSLLRVFYNPDKSDTIEFKTYRTQVPVSFVTSMTYDHIRGRFLVFHVGGISHLNDTLEVIQRYSGNVLQTEQHGTILANQSNYYSFGATRFMGSPDSRDLVFQKYDTSMNVLYSEQYGRADEDDYPFIVKSLDQLNDEYIIGGMYGGVIAFIFKNPLTFFLAKYNSDMERQWYRVFGGDHSYQIRGLHMLDDGRCLVYGYRVDSETGLRYPYLLIVNEDGLISSTEDINESVPDLIKIFSANDSDLLSFEAYELLEDIVLYAMDGRIVKAFGNVDQGRHSYNLSAVPSAMYLLLARSDDGRTQSVKWLKH